MPSYAVGQTVGGNMSVTDTVPGLLGELRVTNTGTFRYGKAASALTAGDLCKFSVDGAYTASILTGVNASLVDTLGVPQVDIPSGSYGWFFVGDGTFNIKTAAGVGGGLKLAWTGTSGTAGGSATPAAGTSIGAMTIAPTGAGGVVACFAPGRLCTGFYA